MLTDLRGLIFGMFNLIFLPISHGQVALDLADQYHRRAAGHANFDTAVIFYQKALELKFEHAAPEVDLAKTSFNLGRLYQRAFHFSEARKNFGKVIEWGDDRLKSKAYLAISKIETELGALASAADYLHLALEYSGPQHPLEFTDAVIDWASMRIDASLEDSTFHQIIGELNLAIVALEGYRGPKIAADTINLAAMHDLLGICYLHLGLCSDCYVHQQKAIALHPDLHYQADKWGNIAICYAHQKRKKLALRLLAKAQSLRELSPDRSRSGLASTFDNIAITFTHSDQPDSAIFYSLRAIHLIAHETIFNIDEDAIRQLGINNQIRLLTYLERLSNNTSKEPNAYLALNDQVFSLLSNLIEEIRLSHLWYQDKQFWQDRTGHIYDQAIEYYFALRDYQKLFYYLERSKSISLKEHFVRAAQAYYTDDSLFRLERQIFHKLETLEESMHDGSPNIADSVAFYKSRYDSVLTSVQRRNYNHFRNLQSPSLEDLQSTLETDELILMYHQGEKLTLCMSVGNQAYSVQQIQIEGFAKTLEEWFRLIKQSPVRLALEEWRTRQSRLREITAKLSSILLPFLTTSVKKITIIPSGNIYHVPFSALTIDHNGMDGDGVSISYSPSIGLLHLMQSHQTEKDDWLGFAPAFEFQAGSKGRFQPLLYNQGEIEKIGAMVDGAAIYESLTEDEFYHRIGSAGILHLATHAQVAIEPGQRSVIVLGDEAGTDLQTSFADVLYRAPPFKMVVLSACETARGFLAVGEGMTSLATSFAGSGTSAIVATLWPVDDEASSQIMQLFYEYLRKGMAKSEAILKAQQAFREQADPLNRDPYFWAPFVVIGDDGPLYSPMFSYRSIFVYIILLLGFSIVGYLVAESSWV